MALRGVHGVTMVLVAVATLLHLWTHAVAADTDASPLDHARCGLHDPGHDPDHDRDPHHHHDSMEHPDGFIVSSGDFDVAAATAWYPVMPTICEVPGAARRLALGVPCRSPPYGHAARTRTTRTLEVCRR